MVVDAVVARADGNAFFLEELVRAIAEAAAADPDAGAGRALDVLPETVIGMVQARLAGLDAEARRVLRAAALFGEVFWEGGVRALVGDGSFATTEWLDDLARREVISLHKEGRLPGEREYQFRHALVRDAAYDMLTEPDRVLGHLLAGQWL